MTANSKAPTIGGSGAGDGLSDWPASPAAPWTRRDMLLAAVTGMAIMTGLVIFLQLSLALLLRAGGVGEIPQATAFVSLLGELGLLVPVWCLGVRKYKVPWSALGLRRFDPARSLGLGILYLLGAMAFNFVWSLALSPLGIRAQPNLLPLFDGGILGLLVALITGGIVAPIAEEVFFRGYLFAGMRRVMGRKRALWLSAGLFALVHIVPASWPPILVLGLLFAVLYEQTDSIWPAVVMHGAINSLSFLIVYGLEALPI